MSRLAAIALENQCSRFEWRAFAWNENAIAFYKGLCAEQPKEEASIPFQLLICMLYRVYPVGGKIVKRHQIPTQPVPGKYRPNIMDFRNCDQTSAVQANRNSPCPYSARVLFLIQE